MKIPADTPLSDWVLILPDPEQSQTSGGIIIPDSAKQRSTKGVIISIGPGSISPDGTLVPIDPSLAPGTRVLFEKYSGHDIEIDGYSYKLIRESGILMIVNDQGG